MKLMLPWPVRSVLAGTAGTATMTLAYAAARRLRPRARGPLDYDDGLIPGTIVGGILHLPDLTDRRSVHAQLTAGGVERVEAIKRDAIDQQTALFARFSRAEIARLRHLCLLLVQQLNRNSGGV